MSEFIALQMGDNQRLYLINKAHIVTAEQTGSGHCIITLINGQASQVQHKMFEEVKRMLLDNKQS